MLRRTPQPTRALLRRTPLALIQLDKQRYTKDGRKRARRMLWGVHRTQWTEKLPNSLVALIALACAGAVYKAYDLYTALTPTQKFMAKLNIVPHSVLGTQLHDTGTLLFVGDSPDAATAIVDPAGLHHIHGVADGAGGASGAIYKWLGLTGRFSDDVRYSVSSVGDAKLAKYKMTDEQLKHPAGMSASTVSSVTSTATAPPPAAPMQPAAGAAGGAAGAGAGGGSGGGGGVATTHDTEKMLDELYRTRNVIHVVGPDFRVGKWTDREASLALTRAYRNLLHEFVISGADTLRVSPVSGGIFSGPLYNLIPVLTQEAIAQGFEQLHKFDQESLLNPRKKVELCVFQLREWDSFVNAFDKISTPVGKLSTGEEEKK